MFALGCHLIVVLAPLPARAEPKLWGLQHPWPFCKVPSPARAGPSALLIGLEACAQLRHRHLELREGLGEPLQRVPIAHPRDVFLFLVVEALIAIEGPALGQALFKRAHSCNRQGCLLRPKHLRRSVVRDHARRQVRVPRLISMGTRVGASIADLVVAVPRRV